MPELLIGLPEIPGSPQQQQQREVAVGFSRVWPSHNQSIGIARILRLVRSLRDHSSFYSGRTLNLGPLDINMLFMAAETSVLGSLHVIIVEDWASLIPGSPCHLIVWVATRTSASPRVASALRRRNLQRRTARIFSFGRGKPW